MEWQQFVMNLETLNPERVEEVLLAHGARSVTFSDAGDNPVLEPAPGETPLWQRTRITGLFGADADLRMLERELKAALAVDRLPEHHVEMLADRDWEREWLRDFGPMRFGTRLWICPGGSEAPEPDAVVVKLDPGLAFGTGTHATTALCLEWLDSLDLEGLSILDYGCGSGVLAIAALKLGCDRAHVVDIDVQAITATVANAEQNDVIDRLTTGDAAATIDAEFDIVVANILAGPLVELATAIAAGVRRGGRLALSGILAEQVDELQQAYAPWFEFEAPALRAQGGQNWARLAGRKR